MIETGCTGHRSTEVEAVGSQKVDRGESNSQALEEENVLMMKAMNIIHRLRHNGYLQETTLNRIYRGKAPGIDCLLRSGWW